MTFRIFTASLAAATLAVIPAAAQAVERTSAPVAEENEMGGSSVVLAILAVAAVVVGLIIALDNGDDAVSA